ncbi:response regulator receiver [Flammeovirgaceae bacterium 311]|nr:response regulator receiver [Flammeovirgaceae bacterium 311]
MNKLRKILLIDDVDVTSYINKLYLENMDIAEEIDYVHDGVEGLQYLHKHCLQGTGPDLIFLDNKMPRMDGFEFLEALPDLEAALQRSFSIAMLTTSVNMKDVSRAVSFGDRIIAYITKPLQADGVKQVLAGMRAMDTF